MSKLAERLRSDAQYSGIAGGMCILHTGLVTEAADMLNEFEVMLRKAHGHAMNGHRSPKTKAQYAERVSAFLAKLEAAR